MKTSSNSFTSSMREGIRNMLRIWIREYQLIFSDVGVLIIILAVPLIYPLLYSLIYYPEVVRDLPVAVADLSRSSQSREFIRKLDATPDVQVRSVTVSMEEAIRLFRENQVRGIVQIPSDYCDALALRRQTNISAYADMEFFLYYKALVTGTSFVALETGRNIQESRLENSGLSRTQSEAIAEPLVVVDNVMANRAGGFASYGIPAALILIIQQTLVLAIGIMAGTARERHPFGTLIPLDKKRMGTLRMVTGKAAAYFSIYAILSVYMLGMIPRWFGYEQQAGLMEVTALITPFILGSVFMGMSLSVVFRKRESALLLYLFTSIPLLFLSGIIWPLSNFSQTWLVVRELFPSSNAMFGYIKMNSLGATIFETRKEILALWIQAGVYFILACLVYSFQVRLSEKLRHDLLALPFSRLKERLKSQLSSR